MLKNWENNGTEEIGLVTPTPAPQAPSSTHAIMIISLVLRPEYYSKTCSILWLLIPQIGASSGYLQLQHWWCSIKCACLLRCRHIHMSRPSVLFSITLQVDVLHDYWSTSCYYSRRLKCIEYCIHNNVAWFQRLPYTSRIYHWRLKCPTEY